MSNLTSACDVAARGIRLLVLDVDGVLSDGRLYYSDQGEELKAFHARDGLGIKMLMSTGVEVAIITARESSIVARRASELGISHCYQGCVNKLARLASLREELALSHAQIAYMGDDLPDLAAMQNVGLPMSVADAAETVAQASLWQSHFGGGRGAVRQACELIMRAQDTLDDAILHFRAPGDSA